MKLNTNIVSNDVQDDLMLYCYTNVYVVIGITEKRLMIIYKIC